MLDIHPMAGVNEKLAQQKREQLQRFISAKKLKVKPWAKAAGVSNGAVRNFLAGRSKTLTQATVDALAVAAGAEPSAIFPPLDNATKPQRENGPVDNKLRMVEVETTGRVEYAKETPGIGSYPRTLKILGHAKAGMEGFFLDQGETQGMAPRIPALQGVKDAFAVYIRDDSMSPAFEADDIVFIHPGLRVEPPMNVVIELTDGQAFIKRLVRRTTKAVICKQWNPAKEVRYDPKLIKAVYRILRPSEWGIM